MVGSNSTTITYNALGGLLAVGDYTNEEDVEKCIT